MRGSDVAIGTFLIIRAVAGDCGDGTVNLIKKWIDLRAVDNIVGGQRRRDDLASVRINTDVQFTSRPAPARAMLLDQPLAGTGQLQSSAVHQQMHRFGVGRCSHYVQRLCPPAECGMVRAGKIQAKQADDRADQSFGLPQRQAKHRPQGQSRRDRQGRIVRLTATGGPRFSPPSRDRLFGEPDR